MLGDCYGLPPVKFFLFLQLYFRNTLQILYYSIIINVMTHVEKCQTIDILHCPVSNGSIYSQWLAKIQNLDTVAYYLSEFSLQTSRKVLEKCISMLYFSQH